MNDRSAWFWDFLGWPTFVASALVFIIASVRAGDIISLIANVLFLPACIFFMIPAWFRRPLR